MRDDHASMIALDGVTKRFGQEVAVDDIHLSVGHGELCVLVGTSGCGKSTTLRMINRLIEHSAGEIRIEGQQIRSFNPDQLRRRIGYAIQNTGLFPHWSVARNIGLVPRLLKWPSTRIEARVEELMSMLDLDFEAFAGKYPAQLSGGQAQRVGVARALAADPDVLLMDEPFGALDPITRETLQEELLALQGRLKKTIVFVTHDMDEALKLADRIVVMQAGRIVQQGTPMDLLGRPADAYVESLLGGRDRGLKHASLMTVSARMRHDSAVGASDVEGVRNTDSLRDALSVMLWRKTAQLPVLDGGGGAYRYTALAGRDPGVARMRQVRRANWRLLLWSLLLLVVVVALPHLDTLMRLWLPAMGDVIYRRDSFLALLGNHIAIVAIAGVIATAIGVGAGIAVTRDWGRDFLPLVSQLASIGQTFPPVAVLALSVPALGFGTVPTIIALVLYGLLPIVRNTLAGLQGIDADVMEAAKGMGLSSMQRLWQVELPLASTILLAGIRTSVTINIATAAIGSTIGAKTLGDPLIAGIVNGNGAYIVQGAIVIALLALCVDSIFERVGCGLAAYDQG